MLARGHILSKMAGRASGGEDTISLYREDTLQMEYYRVDSAQWGRCHVHNVYLPWAYLPSDILH